jgi:hypothetical protein
MVGHDAHSAKTKSASANMISPKMARLTLALQSIALASWLSGHLQLSIDGVAYAQFLVSVNPEQDYRSPDLREGPAKKRQTRDCRSRPRKPVQTSEDHSSQNKSLRACPLSACISARGLLVEPSRVPFLSPRTPARAYLIFCLSFQLTIGDIILGQLLWTAALVAVLLILK